MALQAHRIGNRILDLLLPNEASCLLSSSQTVSMPHGEVVFRENGPMPYVYFPTTGIFGVVIVVEEGKQVEGTTIGNEGMIGLPLFLGLDFHPFVTVTQVPGESLQVPATAFLQAARPGSSLDRVMRRYTAYRLRCANQTAACNSMHLVEERMARWLLMAHDRAASDEFLLTQEFLSELLGVRRQTVSIVAGMLQRAGLITYNRGILQVLDRQSLEAASCECYEVLKQLYNRIVVC